jgi:hypothetical protein
VAFCCARFYAQFGVWIRVVEGTAPEYEKEESCMKKHMKVLIKVVTFPLMILSALMHLFAVINALSLFLPFLMLVYGVTTSYGNGWGALVLAGLPLLFFSLEKLGEVLEIVDCW